MIQPTSVNLENALAAVIHAAYQWREEKASAKQTLETVDEAIRHLQHARDNLCTHIGD